MIRIYNKENNRLEFYGPKPDSAFWDAKWSKYEPGSIASKGNELLESVLKDYAPSKNERMLEAGCGKGSNVYLMDYLGYKNAYGIDFAVASVERAKKYFPGLKLSVQDVRKTDFADDYFDLYFSFGVIEHFEEGYDVIINEASRITKSGGILAISFPHISLFRKMKIGLNIYKQPPKANGNFYQYAFDDKEVVRSLARHDIKLLKTVKYDGIKGLKDEVETFKPILQCLYDVKVSRIAIRIRKMLDILIIPVTNHMIMLICQNEK